MRCVGAAFLWTARLNIPRRFVRSEAATDNAKPVIRRGCHWSDRVQVYSYGCQLVESKVANDCFIDATRQLKR
jgi:hypothetical protein